MSNQFGKKMKGLVWFAVVIGVSFLMMLILIALHFFK